MMAIDSIWNLSVWNACCDALVRRRPIVASHASSAPRNRTATWLFEPKRQRRAPSRVVGNATSPRQPLLADRQQGQARSHELIEQILVREVIEVTRHGSDSTAALVSRPRNWHFVGASTRMLVFAPRLRPRRLAQVRKLASARTPPLDEQRQEDWIAKSLSLTDDQAIVRAAGEREVQFGRLRYNAPALPRPFPSLGDL